MRIKGKLYPKDEGDRGNWWWGELFDMDKESLKKSEPGLKQIKPMEQICTPVVQDFFFDYYLNANYKDTDNYLWN